MFCFSPPGFPCFLFSFTAVLLRAFKMQLVCSLIFYMKKTFSQCTLGYVGAFAQANGFFKLQHASELPEWLLKTPCSPTLSGAPDSERPWWGPRICISNKRACNADASGPGTICGNHWPLYMVPKPFWFKYIFRGPLYLSTPNKSHLVEIFVIVTKPYSSIPPPQPSLYKNKGQELLIIS